MAPINGTNSNNGINKFLTFGGVKNNQKDASKLASKELGNHFASIGKETDYPGLSITRTNQTAGVNKVKNSTAESGMPDVSKYVSPESKARIEASMQDFDKNVAANQAGATNVIKSDFGSKFSDKTIATVGTLATNIDKD